MAPLPESKRDERLGEASLGQWDQMLQRGQKW